VTVLSPAQLALQTREFLARHRDAGIFTPACDAWLSGFSPSFSRLLGDQGWIGLTWPVAYGGLGLGQRHRFAVTEELLAAGAPVAAHWIADRQSGPSILQYGTEEQKRRFLPQIAAGQCFFAIGMSEPDSGSDLASVRTTARKTDSGWVLAGRKLWTSHAHRAHQMITLCRTAAAGEDRHAGLSQLIVDLKSPGITVNPVRLIDGGHHFNEVFLDDVVLPESALLGVEGQGWEQVTRELTFERGGPERYMSTFPLVVAALARSHDGPASRQVVGKIVADLWSLRQLSVEVLAQSASSLRPAALSAAITKDLGTRLEQDLIDAVRQLVETEADQTAADDYERLLAEAILHSPGFTIRGGTTEILRGVISKMSGLQ
jgi:acyl-CoA dehydrogenase